jgi:hypothetical protein
VAWFYIAYACGHDGREQIYGPMKNREWIAEQRAQKVCHECYATDLAQRRAIENHESAEKAKEEGLPNLIGTEKQVAYGETCRVKLFEALEKLFENRQILDHWEKDGHDQDDLANAFAVIAQETSAAWWIDTQKLIQTTLEGYKFVEKFIPSKDISVLTIDEKAAIDAETTVIPENAVTHTVATIATQGDRLTISFPERRDNFRTLVKSELGMTWSDTHWSRKITVFSGSMDDRIVEAGNVLLVAGYPVRIADMILRERAIAGDFAPEQTKWIFVHDNHPGLICISWNRHTEDYYDVARRLPTSQWHNPNVYVRSSAYEEIIDFAARYHFSIRPSAQKLMDAAKKTYDDALRVKVNTPDAIPPSDHSATPNELEVPSEVMIDAEFRDID